MLAGIVLIALPMFGDYYTPDLMSGSPKTAMLGNAINGYVQGGPDKSLGAALTMLLAAFLLIFMLYYLRVAARRPARGGGRDARSQARPAVARRTPRAARVRSSNPWGGRASSR